MAVPTSECISNHLFVRHSSHIIGVLFDVSICIQDCWSSRLESLHAVSQPFRACFLFYAWRSLVKCAALPLVCVYRSGADQKSIHSSCLHYFQTAHRLLVRAVVWLFLCTYRDVGSPYCGVSWSEVECVINVLFGADGARPTKAV